MGNKHSGTSLAMREDIKTTPPSWLPPEIAAQPALAHAAFAKLAAKPGRSLASIARELGTSPHTIGRLANAGRWAYHLRLQIAQSKESLLIAAEMEAQRSRAAALGSNRLFEGMIEASALSLAKLDEQGGVRLNPGVEPGDVEKLARARQTHVKTTMLITGEAAATARGVAAAGATKVVLGAELIPQPLPVAGRVVSSEESPGA